MYVMRYQLEPVRHRLSLVALLLAASVSLAVTPAAPVPGTVTCDAWYCIGPFKEGLFENVVEAFNTVYPPEAAILASPREAPDLAGQYTAKSVPGLLDTSRTWVRHDTWTDGYRHLLPRGPAPSRSEVVYLFRRIHAATACEVAFHVNAEDYIRLWLNGRELGAVQRRYGPSRFPSALRVKGVLQAGANNLLIKIASIHAAHGFAFSIPSIHPGHPLRPGEWHPSLRGRFPHGAKTGFTSANQPYASADPPAASAVADDAARHRDALARIRGFRGDLRMTPMFDPPASEMYETAHAGYPASSGGAAYVLARENVKRTITSALASDGADAAPAHIAAAEAVRTMWGRQIRALPPIAFVRRPHAKVNAIAPYWHHGTSPSSICVFTPSHPETPVRVVFHDPELAIYDMNLSWDARTLFFAGRRPGGHWQLYEVGVDGGGLKRITHNDDADFISPVELPSGDLMFVSTQADTWVQCQGKKAGLLYTCRRDGSGTRKVSANIDSDHTPQVMNDGRVLFTRWDYGVEKNVFARHALWSMNPDGTGFRLFAGNTIEDPAGFWKARPIPGRPEVVCVFGPHHSYQAGMLGLVWNQLGPEAPRGKGFRFVTDEIPSYCDTACGHGYQDPFPLNERLFLVSYGGDGGSKNRLYLVDDHGNRQCVYEAGGELGCWYPLPLAPRPRPPAIATQKGVAEWQYREPAEMNRDPDASWGTLYVQDVYRGLAPWVQRGQVKSIAIMEQVQKSRCMAGGEAWGHTPIIGRGTVHARRVIGTVPVAADGSAFFTVPALRSISLNALDAEGRTLMRMGSDMHIMPGEQQSCIGCHENRHGATAPPARPAPTMALAQGPVTPTAADWGTAGLLDYQAVVQPVLDRHCLRCHGGARPAAGMSLAGDRTRFFCVSYDNLIDRGLVEYTNVFALDHDENTPLTLGAIVSPLRKRLESDHCGHAVPPADRWRLYAWIDANVPYYSTYTYTKVRGIGARDSWETGAGKDRDGWMVGHVAPVFDKRCMDCHQRTRHNQALYGKASFTVSSDLWTVRGVTAHGAPNRYPMSLTYGPEFRINLTNPEHSLMLQAPLAKAAGGLGLCEREGEPVFTDREDPDYRRILAAIEDGKTRLYEEPRVDMDDQHVARVLPSLVARGAIDTVLSKYAKRMAVSGDVQAGGIVLPGLVNVAARGVPSSPDQAPLDGGPPRVSLAGAIDGDRATIWDDRDGRGPYRYRLTFAETTPVAAISIEGWGHHDFSPRDFVIVCDDAVVGTVTDARYRQNQLVVALTRTVPCKTLELKITGWYGGSPAMRELGVYSPQD